MTNSQQMVRIVEEYGDAKNRHDVAAALVRCTDDFFLEIVPFGKRVEGKAVISTHLGHFMAAFPDYAGESTNLAVGSETVVVEWTLRGTMRGRFLGMAPTGRAIAVPHVSTFVFRDGGLAGERILYDVATLCRQAGLAIPRAALPAATARVRDAVA